VQRRERVSERVSTMSSAKLCPAIHALLVIAQQERRKDDTLDELELPPPDERYFITSIALDLS